MKKYDLNKQYNELDRVVSSYPVDLFEGKRLLCPNDLDIIDMDSFYKLHGEFINGELVSLVKSYISGGEIELIERLDYQDINWIDYALEGQSRSELIRYFTFKASELNIKSITSFGYNISTKKGVSMFKINQDDYDIVIKRESNGEINLKWKGKE